MRSPILLSALLSLVALASAALADVTNSVPTSVSGGSGTVSAIQSADGTFYSAAKGNTINIGGFPSVGGDISSVVLHVQFSVAPGGYTGTNPIRVNGINTPITPASGDTDRTASIDITAGGFQINTWPEVTALAVTFTNNDTGQGQSVRFDHAYLVINHSPPLNGPPTWSDEFDGSGPPNPAFWTFEQGFVRNEELQWYQNNAWQEGGNLIIEARREQVPNPNYNPGSTNWKLNREFAQYTSASIVSSGKYSFQYGRMQVRAKIPCVPGSWPAIWTLGDTGEWPSNGECDVLEYYATDSVLANCARGTTTRWTAAWDVVKKPVSTFTAVNPNWRNEYHVWTMQWDEQNVRLYIDNHLMNTTAQSWLVNPTTQWGPAEPFKQPHFLLLNLAIGSNGGNPAGTTFPLRYEIDHVRVWEGLTENTTPTDIALSSSSVPEGLPANTGVGNLTATDVDAAEVHSFSLVAGTGDTHNSSFEVVFHSDQTKTSVLRTKAVLNYAAGATRSIRVRVTDIEGATYDKVMTVNVAPSGYLVTSAGNLAAAGSYGGPFTPASLQYTLSNSGPAPLDWAAGNTAAWLTLSSTGGTLAVGENTTVTVSINSAANSLAVGDYSGTVSFTNTTNGNGDTTRTGSLTVGKTPQFITFAAPGPVLDNAAPFALTATASSGLTVSYSSSNTSVATVSGSTVTVTGLGSTTITASQAGNADYDPATAVPQTLTVDRANPLAVITGSYLVLFNQSLSLNASGSHPSYGETITDYSWDLNNDGTFGDVTGATPAPVGYADLTTTWGMVEGFNTIRLRVTDSSGKTSTVSTAVEVVVGLTWDANAATANRTDGAGAWLTASQWWDGTTNQDWSSGSSATFGNGGAGGAVALADATSVNTLVFNSFSGTYTLGTAGNALTLNGGIVKNPASGAAGILSPLTLGAAQDWTNHSATNLTVSAGLNNNGNLLTVDGSGITTFATSATSIISGSGGITMIGSGRLFLGAGQAPAHTYSGTTTIHNGSILISNNLGGGNLTIDGGYLDFYFGGTFTRALGSDAGQVSIPGGTSGFSNNGSTGGTIRFNNNATTEIVWGSASFNPATLVLQAANAQNSSTLTLDNKLDLNGADRTIFTSVTTGTAAGSATLSQIVRNSQGTPAGLIKTGSGRLNLNAANTYNGGTTLQAGTLQLGNATALGSTSGPLTVNGGLLNLNDQTVSVGNLTGTGGTIANNASNARTLTIGSGNGNGGNYQGVIANKTNAGTGSVALAKTGTGTITLAGLNTYTGATIINGGGTLVLTGATQATTAITFASNSSLGLVIGSPVTAASAAVNFANGTVSVTGTPSAPSHVLLTALSFAGTPVLASPVPGYELQVVGNQLQLTEIVVADPYTLWSGGAAFDTDSNNDGVDNGLAWLLGAANPSESALGRLPVASQSGGNLVLDFSCLKSANRGTALLKLQYSRDLGITDAWALHEAAVPGDAGGNVNGVVFVPGANANPALIHMQATVPAAAATPGSRLFGRLSATP